MKKIFTLLLAMGSLTAVFAQSGRDYKEDRRYQDKGNNQNNGYAYNDRHDNSAYNREKAFQLEKINRDYDYRLNLIMRTRHMRPSERNRMLRNLDIERAARIREINDRFDHHRFDDNHYDRGNNYHH